jgi:penicillin-binding protein 1C
MKSYFVLPPAAEHYYKHNHPNFESLPDFQTGCSGDGKGLDIIYPMAKSSIKIPVLLSGKTAGIIFEAVHRQPDMELFWYIDGEFITTTSQNHQLEVSPSVGKHRLTITDKHGEKRTRVFTVI